LLSTDQPFWKERFRGKAARTHPGLTASALHTQYLADVYRYVSRRLAHREDAVDVTAECFAAAFLALPRFRGECEPRLWLLGIARRKVAAALRRSASRREVMASDTEVLGETASDRFLPVAAAASEEAQDQLRRIILALNPPQREALLLHYVEGLTHQEIAVVLKRSPQAVNSLLQRARASVLRQGRSYFLDEEVSQ
jgi:RNA polymerase sigma-70 factor (ECF subfamily)